MFAVVVLPWSGGELVMVGSRKVLSFRVREVEVVGFQSVSVQRLSKARRCTFQVSIGFFFNHMKVQ